MDLAFLYPYIIGRKSVRSYTDAPVDEAVIDELVDFLSDLTPPQEDIDWNFDTLTYMDMVHISAREPGVKAPHYLVLRAERKNFSLQNSGYIGEMAALWLCSRGISSCWQGGITISEDYPDTLPFVAALAFGYSDEPLRTSKEQFTRLPLNKIAMGDFIGFRAEVAEAVRLAPSSMNRQPVRMLAADGKIHIFRKYVFLKNPVISYAQCIDAGVAMAHIHAAAAASGHTLSLQRRTPEPQWANNIYQITAVFD